LKHELYEIVNLKNKAGKQQVWREKMYELLSCSHVEMTLIEFMAVDRVILQAAAEIYFLCDTIIIFSNTADNQNYYYYYYYLF